jgi:ribonuclease J
VSGPLRVLPLGGLGEIGKNMTVVEYDGRIIVVDTGLRFPTADMLGIDLVLPDFTYLRERCRGSCASSAPIACRPSTAAG